MNDRATSRPENGRNFLAIIASIFAGGAMIFMTALPASVLLMLIRNFDRKSFVIIPTILIVVLAGFTSGRLAAAFSDLRGWLCGVITSIGLLLLLRLLSLLVGGGTIFSLTALLTFLMLLLSGVAGGVVGAVKR